MKPEVYTKTVDVAPERCYRAETSYRHRINTQGSGHVTIQNVLQLEVFRFLVTGGRHIVCSEGEDMKIQRHVFTL